MKDINNYNKELKNYMEKEAGKNDLIFNFPKPETKRNPVPFITAAAAILLAVPLSVITTFSVKDKRDLILEENRIFVENLFNNNSYKIESQLDLIFDTNWFDLDQNLF